MTADSCWSSSNLASRFSSRKLRTSLRRCSSSNASLAAIALSPAYQRRAAIRIHQVFMFSRIITISFRRASTSTGACLHNANGRTHTHTHARTHTHFRIGKHHRYTRGKCNIRQQHTANNHWRCASCFIQLHVMDAALDAIVGALNQDVPPALWTESQASARQRCLSNHEIY